MASTYGLGGGRGDVRLARHGAAGDVEQCALSRTVRVSAWLIPNGYTNAIEDAARTVSGPDSA